MPYYIYLITNEHNTTIYTGVTNDLAKRIREHKDKIGAKFTKKYNLSKLVYFEEFSDPLNAIQREKQIKAGSRAKKVRLIESMNEEWKDLSIE